MPAPGLDAAVVAALWPRRERVQLNHGSFGGVTAPVLARWQELQHEEEANPHEWYRRLPERVAAATSQLAGWLGAEPRHSALVPNASAGTTLALQQLTARRVVVTDHGYGAVDHAVARTGLPVERVHVPLEADDEEVLSRLGEALRPGDMLVLDAITSPTAKVLPVAGARALAEVLVVDAAHAPGQLTEPPVGDAWVGNLHKWPAAPRGTALLQADGLLPATASWWEGGAFPERFAFQGTQQYAHWLAAPSAVTVVEERLGWQRVREACSALVEQGQRLVCEALGVAPPQVGTPAPMMRLVELPDGPRDDVEAHALRDRIAAEHGIEVAVTAWQRRGFVRISAHAYNDLEDYARLAEALRRL